MVTDHYIQILAQSYFWVFILFLCKRVILLIFDSTSVTDSIEASIKNGTYLNDFYSLISWVLFVTSCYLK